MNVLVNIPFIDKNTGKEQKVGKKMKVTKERLAEILSVNINMVTVIEDEKTAKE